MISSTLFLGAVLLGLPVCQGSPQRRATWPTIPPGASWALRAWCPHDKGSGAACHEMDIANKAVVTIDMFDTSAYEIQQLKNNNHFVVCYISAGSYERWRPDSEAFPDSIKGLKLSKWDEIWLDIRPDQPSYPTLLSLMENRIRLAGIKGCDGIELDNVDCWQNYCLPNIGKEEQFMYDNQIKYNKYLAGKVHDYNMAVGLKNTVRQVNDLVDYFDFAINEECFEYNECDQLLPFVKQNKAVFGVSYRYGSSVAECQKAIDLAFTWLVAVDSDWMPCNIAGQLNQIKDVANTPIARPTPTTATTTAPPTPTINPTDVKVDGKWSDWGKCSQPCAGGVQVRTCTNPPPQNGGSICVGNASALCNLQACLPCTAMAPVNGQVFPDSGPHGLAFAFSCNSGYGPLPVGSRAVYMCTNGVLPPFSCPDTNECTSNLHNCDFNAQCTNIVGSFTCACNVGFAGNGMLCEALNMLGQGRTITAGGKQLVSRRGHKGLMQTDGNFVLYDCKGTPYYNTQTAGIPGPPTLTLEKNALITFKDRRGIVQWSLGSALDPALGPYTLWLLDDGSMIIQNGQRVKVWEMGFNLATSC
eukprot:comp17874_c0_seq1/m.18084 comp17874_c0_seq1/g.18084  ORF comp17874_c0_seq1/g.18084 comp17874_c0_seq1/m.18084 type:complete len:585 (-) comp17874_c0_seq1:151-1905(-)